MICGYCRGPMPEHPSATPGRCPCGQRAITRLGAGVFVHPPGCSGDACDCVEAFARSYRSATV